MPKFARLDQNSTVIETFDWQENPGALFDPSWEWIECPADTQANATYKGGKFTNPAAPEPGGLGEPPPATPVNIPVPHFKMRFTPEERVTIKAAAIDPNNPYSAYVADWLELTNDPRLEYVTPGDPNLDAAIQMLVGAGLLIQDRAAQILAPYPMSACIGGGAI